MSLKEPPRLNSAAGPHEGDVIPGATVVEITADDAEIGRLAALKPLDYERERGPAMERLGIKRVSILDKLVTAEHDKAGIGAAGNDAAGQGKPLNFVAVEAWPEPVDGAELLDEVAAAIRRHVVLAPAEAQAAALWTVGTYLMDGWYIFPRLFASAPESECGKSTLLDVLSRLVARALPAISISAAALFRTIEAARPTLLLDEADTYLTPEHEDLRGVVDGGHCRTGAVIRTVGDEHEPRQFSCWAAVALAAIGRLHVTIEGRSIIIRLRRRREDEPVAPLRLERAGHLDALARKIARWARDHAGALAAADPEMPAGIYNRVADNWRPLLAIAHEAGGDWPMHARLAAVEMTRDGAESTRVMLLSDIRAAFDEKKTDRLSSDDLVAHLIGLDDRPWSEFTKGKPLTKPGLARLLRPFKIFSGTIRFDDGRDSPTAKGYYRSTFRDAFDRYAPPDQNVTTSQARQSAAFSDFQNVTRGNGVTFRNGENPSVSAGCDGVTDRNPVGWPNGDARPQEPPSTREPGEDLDEGGPAWDAP
jgi:putative DNA primase/helicase